MGEGQRSVSQVGSSAAPLLAGVRRTVAGLLFPRLLSRADLRPAEAVSWTHRDLTIHDGTGRVLRDVEVPQDWSAAASLAFLVRYAGVGQEEWPEGVEEPLSVRQCLDALLSELRLSAIEQQYFSRDEDADVFADELSALLLAQGAAFADAPEEGGAWRWDSEQGAPAKRDADDGRHGGRPSRVLLTPDQEQLRAQLERWARGENASGAAGAANAVVLLPETLMLSAEHARGRELPEPFALLTRAIAQSSGPAVSFTRNVERWNPTPETSSVAMLAEPSPCAATLNLQRFIDAGGELDLAALRHAACVMTAALEMGVDRRLYRTEATAWAMHRSRPLALGFANLGVLLMSGGVAYGSPGARRLSAAIASLLLGEATMQSARMAETCAPLRGRELGRVTGETGEMVTDGACEAFVVEPQRFLAMVRQQRAETYRIVRGSEHTAAPGSTPGDVIPIRPERPQDQPALMRQLPEIVNTARASWDAALTHGERFGFRNAQWTALLQEGPGQTMLDVETAALEPVRTLFLPERRQSGSEAAELRVRQAVAAGLFRLLYSAGESEAILQHLETGGSLGDAPFLRAEDRAVFDCGPGEAAGVRGEAELQMLAAVQPFLSAANPYDLHLAEPGKPEEIAAVLLEGWRTGIKALRVLAPRLEAATEPATEEAPSAATPAGAVAAGDTAVPAMEVPQVEVNERSHSDGHAASAPESSAPPSEPSAPVQQHQPTLAEAERELLAGEQAALLETQLQRIADLEVQILELQHAARASADAPDAKEPPRSVRHRLPAERASITHKFSVAGHEGYITVGLYPNGSPGEIFLRMNRESSSVAGLLDAFAITASLALQHGVPLHTLTEHLSEMRFEPSGDTANPQIPHARSIMQYLFEWMEQRFLTGDQMDLFRGVRPVAEAAVPVTGDVHGPTGRVTPRAKVSTEGAEH